MMIENWKKSHKFWSVRLSAIAGICAVMQMILPAWEGVLPENTFAILSAVAATGAIIGRLINQKELDDD